MHTYVRIHSLTHSLTFAIVFGQIYINRSPHGIDIEKRPNWEWMKWAAGQTLSATFHFMIIFKLCAGAYIHRREKIRVGAHGRGMFKMHAYKTLCNWTKTHNENMNSLRPVGTKEKYTRIANVFVINSGREKKSIGKISIMGFNCTFVRSVMGKKTADEEKKKTANTQAQGERVSKINGEHNRKARANFSHFPTLHSTLRFFASRVLCPSKNYKINNESHTHISVYFPFCVLTHTYPFSSPLSLFGKRYVCMWTGPKSYWKNDGKTKNLVRNRENRKIFRRKFLQ